MSSTAEQSASPGASGSDQGPPQQPVTPAERIYSIDVLRGVAVLGILVINIWIFALPELAYVDVTAKEGNAQLNLATWVISEIVFEGKMRAVLSMRFGAGVILLTSRIEARGGRADVTDIYYRRNIWLLAFGVAQAFLLIWSADFIYAYALVGLVLFPFRKMRAETLIVIGLLLLAFLVPKRIIHSNHLRSMQAAAVKAEAALVKSTGQKSAAQPEDEQIKPAGGLSGSPAKETDTASQDASVTDATKQTDTERESETLSEGSTEAGKQTPAQDGQPKESADEEENELRQHQRAKKQWDAKLTMFRHHPNKSRRRLKCSGPATGLSSRGPCP